jgi:hypothetical protein
MNVDKISRGVLSLIIVSVMIAPALALEDPYPQSRFVEASYEMTPDGVIEFGESVWATITLTNFSKEIDESKFFFYSELDAPQWSVTVDGVAVAYEKPFVINHSADVVTIALAGRAPEIGFQKEIVIARIDENTTTNDYTVLIEKRTVTSDEIQKVVIAIDESKKAIERANNSIQNATMDTSDATDDLGMAERYLQDAEDYYVNKKMNASLAAAENATYYANKAYENVQSIESSASTKKYVIYGVIALIIIAVLVILYQRSKRDKLGKW